MIVDLINVTPVDKFCPFYRLSVVSPFIRLNLSTAGKDYEKLPMTLVLCGSSPPRGGAALALLLASASAYDVDTTCAGFQRFSLDCIGQPPSDDAFADLCTDFRTSMVDPWCIDEVRAVLAHRRGLLV